MLYEKLKTFVKINRRRFALLAAGAAVFAVGYGTGRSNKLPLYENLPSTNAGKPSNYSTGGGGATTAGAAKQAKTAGDPNCPVKGNIVSKSEKKYYLPSDRGYAQVKPEECFSTEAEAQAAGYSGAGG